MHQREERQKDHSRPRRRGFATAGAVLAAAILVSTGTAASAAPAGVRHPATSATGRTAGPATAGRYAAGWLARHLTGARHDHYVDVVSGKRYPDYGNTADAILAFDSAHVARKAATRATNWLAANIAGYADDTCDPQHTTYYPGSLAKALIVAEAQHRNTHRFGGLNLVKTLTAEETPRGQAQAGLYADPDTTCGYQSPVTQSLALIALTATGSSSARPDRAAVRWLVGQQCGNGGFLPSIRTGNSGCHTSAEDVDTTAFAIQALRAVRARTAATKASHWLIRQRHRNGSFGNPPTGANVNSTAVAVQALLVDRDRKLAAAGQRWIAKRQVGCGQPAGRRGSLDYQGRYAGGSTQLTATTQGAQALAGGVLARIDRAHASGANPQMTCHK